MAFNIDDRIRTGQKQMMNGCSGQGKPAATTKYKLYQMQQLLLYIFGAISEQAAPLFNLHNRELLERVAVYILEDARYSFMFYMQTWRVC